ncbi:DUF4160 domain-containing protein [Burkholderia gladioli]|uniref:DUF4160 domain-containing protein n=1 Tax=Burkholderia gladioli TaxID=28095 RepID=UPI00163FC2A2|nr:DUF4160 domain-containing protein [Burkholderia gladioli]
MPERLLILHWNELSFPAGITAEDLLTDLQWKARAVTALRAIRAATQVRPDCRISFTRGVFHGEVGGRPFLSWLETWLGRDGLRFLQGRAVQPILEPIYAIGCEVSCNGRAGEGITRAHLAESWAWSLSHSDSGSDGVLIVGQKILIDQQDEIAVEVANLAADAHVLHWKNALSTYGRVLSENHVIAELGRYTIIMYPLDHGYPHIHVHSRDDGSMNAKFRIDLFEPLTDEHPKELNTLLEQWVQERKEGLTVSWKRCQEGCFPLKL